MPRTPLDLEPKRTALVVVDLQRYYLDPEGPFVRYFESRYPGASDDLRRRCNDLVIPNVRRLAAAFRERSSPICFLRLCGREVDRSDLHPTFKEHDQTARQRGFADVYPLESDPQSAVAAALVQPGDVEICKTTYSAFTSSGFPDWARRLGLKTLVFTGLATSQCVDTTARDAADRALQVVHIEDAQADYDPLVHRASLYVSQAVCGGHLYSTGEFLERLALS